MSSGSSPCGLSLPWTFKMVSLDLQEKELEGFRRSQCLELASLRTSLHPHSSGQSCLSPHSDSRRRGTTSTFLKGKAEKGASQVVLVVKNPSANAGDIRKNRFKLWVGKIPWSKAWQSSPIFLPGESHGWRSLVGYGPWGCKGVDTTEAI